MPYKLISSFFSKEIMMLVFKPIFHGGQYSTHGEWFMSPYNDDTFKGSYIEVVFEYKHLYTWLSPGKDLVLNCLSFKITFHNVIFYNQLKFQYFNEALTDNEIRI